MNAGQATNPSAVVTAGLDLLSTGIGVFGTDYRLCYCNAAFRDLRSLPEALCRPGTLLTEIVRHLAERGDYGPGDTEAQVERRMAEITRMQPWEVEQDIPGGRRLLISHTPVPVLGLMITYSDVTEARATERKLRENEERYALVSQAVAEGIYDWNIEADTLFFSPRLMEIFGFEGPGLSSENWFWLVHAADREAYRSALRSCFRGESPSVHCEYRILVHTGEYRWVEDRGLPIRNATGRAIRLVGAVSDVTGRKETERALRESEERHELALQAINESVYEWDIVTGEMYYSPRLHAIVGLAAEELRTAEDWLQRIHQDDLPAYRAAMLAHLRGETERFEVEYRYRHSDGAWHWARQHGLALKDENGRAIRLAGSTGDITAEKQMAEELEGARRQLQDAIEAIAEGFVLFDPQDRIVMCNARYRAFFNEVADQVRPGNTFEAFMRSAVGRGMFPAAEADPEGWIASLLERRRQPTGPRETRMASGVHLQVSDYKMKDGSHVAVYTDVSDLRKRQDELMRAKAEAESALERLQAAQKQLVTQEKLASLGQLTAGIAHEIKNPLNFVNNFSTLSRELLDELKEIVLPALAGAGSSAAAEAADLIAALDTNLSKVADHGGRADRIVKNMLKHSRHGEAQRSRADVNALVEESLNLAYHGARAENQQFNIRIDKRLDPSAGEVDGFPQDLLRVFLNLFSNDFYAAHKRKHDGGGDDGFEPSVDVSTRGTETAIEIRVRDNGVGIPTEVRDRLFTPFFTTKPPGEGTGLGLSLSYDIVVKQHGGGIAVQSEPNAYTEFVVTIPRQAPSDTGSADANRKAAQ